MKRLFAILFFSIGIISTSAGAYTEVWCYGAPVLTPYTFSQTGYGWRDLPQVANIYVRRQIEARDATYYALEYVNAGCRNIDGRNCAQTQCRITRQYP